MKIGQKLILGFIAIALLVGVVGTVAIKYNIQILFDVDQILLSNSKELKAATETSYYLQKIHSKTRELLSVATDQTTQENIQTRKAIKNSIYKLEQYTFIWKEAIKLGIELSDQKQSQTAALKEFESLKTKIGSLILLVNKTIVLQKENSLEETRLFFKTQVEPLLLEVQELAKGSEKRTRKELAIETEKIRNAVSNSAGISVISTVIGILGVIIIRFLINRTISNPIIKLKDAITKIGKGEFETKIEINSNDEIGILAQFVNDMTPKLKASHTKLEEMVHDRTAELEEEATLRHLAQKKLQQQIKHLNCFYGLSKLVEPPNILPEQIFQETVNLIRRAYQHPDFTCVRITFDGIPYKTDNFNKSELSQYALIKLHGEKAGKIEVYYLGQRPQNEEHPLIEAERHLLDAVAERLGRIAELKQAGERVELFRNLTDHSNDCIFVIEPKWGRFLDVNERACHSLGYTRQEMLGMTVKNIDEFIQDGDCWQNRVDELKIREDIIEDGKFRRKDQTCFFVEMSLRHITQDKKHYVLVIARDITERKIAEEKQIGLIQELRDFAHIVSHDLKAPLLSIRTLADWISTDCADDLDEDGKEQMSLLMAQVERMHNLINGVLQYSKVGRDEQKELPVDLNQIVPDIIEMVAAPPNIAITIEDQLPVVKCEPTRIGQVFENLLSNAIKYMDKPNGEIKISCIEEDGFWKFGITDNGPGIEDKHFERIFQMFRTLTSRDEYESTGIGLTVIKKIVEMYKGKVWVESEVGQGSTFFFTLPELKEELTNAQLQANFAC